MSQLITRRQGLIAASALTLAGCDRLSHDPSVQRILAAGEAASRASQRALMVGRPLAHEFTTKDISRVFKANGSTSVAGEEYARWVETGFADWRLRIGGLVQTPMSLSLAQLKQLPARTQITRHDCVEGWSAIGAWTGPQLGPILKAAGVMPQARYILFRCADNLDGEAAGQYYETIDLVDAYHPQTILAYAMNGAPLEVAHGAPIRARVERQLGYKQAKFVMAIEAIDSFRGLGRGKGGYWEDRGYEWYAGI